MAGNLQRRRGEKRLLALDFNSGRCDVGNCELEVRNIGLDSVVRASSRRDWPGRESERRESFHCGFPECADDGRLVSGRNGADFFCG